MYRNEGGFCSQYIQPNSCLSKHVQEKMFNCAHRGNIYTSFLDDLVVDCPFGEDEPALLKPVFDTTCEKSYQVPCRKGHPLCYNITDICIYRLRKNVLLYPCRNGAHLEECQSFECNLNFKCVISYCVTWTLVCDGMWDCPGGEDENCILRNCAKMFKCRQTAQTCVHIGQICDGVDDCHLGDDELLCELHAVVCPPQCTCLSFAISCSDFRLAAGAIMPFMFVSFQNVQSVILSQQLGVFLDAVFYVLPFNQITTICRDAFTMRVVFIDLSFNIQTSIGFLCFSALMFLNILHLNSNIINIVQSLSFYALPKLSFLNLADNPLTSYQELAAVGLAELKLLSVFNTTLRDITSDALTKVEPILLISDSYHICCLASTKSKCLSTIPWYVNCAGLIPNMPIRVAAISTALLISGVNTFSILLHMMRQRTSKSFKRAIVFACLTNALYVGYLSCVVLGSILHGRNFIIFQERWKSSFVCFFAFGCVLWFTILSSSLSIFTSALRLLVVIKPMESTFKETRFVKKCMGTIFVASFMVVICMLLFYKFTLKMLPFAFCFPFVEPTQSLISAQAVVYVFTSVHSLTPIATTLIHISLVQNVTESKRIQASKSKGNDGDGKRLILQLAVITISSMVCVYPSNVTFILATALTPFSLEIVLWSIVVIVPITALVHLTVFSIVCVKNIWAGRK